MQHADPQQRRRSAAIGGPRALSLSPPVALRAAIVVLAAAFAFALVTPAQAQTPGWVDTGGDCLLLRTEPGLNSGNHLCMDHGEPITLLDAVEELDGFTWRQVEYESETGTLTGWVAEFYITTDPDEVQEIHEPELEASGGIPTPPSGGLTMGLAGVTHPAALAASLPFEVVSIWHFDLDEQQMLLYIPGAPAFVNTLTALREDSIVTIRRAGQPSAREAVPEPPLTVAGTPEVLWVPPIGGMTQGLSGTTDPYFLVIAQEFTAASVSYFHIPSQTWLTYIPGAPEHVNTLQQGHLRVDSVVSIRRGPDVPRTQPTSEESDYFETSITYYYCVPGDNPASIGDGGGYCGSMSNGERVHEGAAACSPRHLGQRFRIEGDPTERIYTCTDGGGSVLRDHRDIWFMNSDDGYAWWLEVGERAFIQIIREEQAAVTE